MAKVSFVLHAPFVLFYPFLVILFQIEQQASKFIENSITHYIMSSLY